MLATFTPFMGMSRAVLTFLPGGRPKDGAMSGTSGGKWFVICPIIEVPHISPIEREKLAASYMRHEREARLKGIPSLGAGAIYAVPESDVVCAPFTTAGLRSRRRLEPDGRDMGCARSPD
jgi:hypothetical protein